MNYNGKREPTLRIYDSMRNFIGENKVHKCGDILCISTKNNDDYDLFIMADGKSTVRELLKQAEEEAEYEYIMTRKS